MSADSTADSLTPCSSFTFGVNKSPASLFAPGQGMHHQQSLAREIGFTKFFRP
jgi:hypothetical protein